MFKTIKDFEISCEQKISNAYANIMNLIFTNTIIKETVVKKIPVKNGDYIDSGYNGQSLVRDGGEHIEEVLEEKTTEKQ